MVEVLEKNAFLTRIKQEEHAQIVDVRTPVEFEGGHLDGAVNINYFSWRFRSKMKQFDKAKLLFVYCASQKRSQLAIHILKGMGFNHLIDLKAGYRTI